MLEVVCSTPFGDIDGCTVQRAVRKAVTVECSTPFGDIDGCTSARFTRTWRDAECSTPFGDIDGCTTKCLHTWWIKRSAQRLAATLMDARDGAERLIEPRRVLNAFRRH